MSSDIKVELPFSPAAERNSQPILRVLSQEFVHATRVLEIGAGTGQHAAFFSQKLPHLQWQATDVVQNLPAINARLQSLRNPRVAEAIELDVNTFEWQTFEKSFDAVFSANTLHILDLGSVESLFRGLPAVCSEASTWVFYGPFNVAGEYTSASNEAFDLQLRARGSGSCIKDIEWLQRLASAQQWVLTQAVAMPANNQILIFKRNE